MRSTPSVFGDSIEVSTFDSLSSTREGLVPFEVLPSYSSISIYRTKRASLSSTVFESVGASGRLPYPNSLSASVIPPVGSAEFLIVTVPEPIPYVLFIERFSTQMGTSGVLSLGSTSVPVPLSRAGGQCFTWASRFSSRSSTED